MVMNGDMVNGGRQSAYNTFNMLLDEIFGKGRKAMPPVIYPMGNHEYYCPDAEKCFREQTGFSPDVHYVLNGIHFIGISCSDGVGGYGKNRLDYLKRHLEIAAGESCTNPIIVISHMPFHVDEFYGGEYCSAQANEMYAILKNYPQVIYFCGHSHFPIASEKSLIQKDFTMVNTGGIGYFDLLWNPNEKGILDDSRPNEYVNPHLVGIHDQQDISERDGFNQGWEMTVDSRNGKVELQRMDYAYKRPFGEPVVMNDLFKKHFPRTLAKLKNEAKAPKFAPDAGVNVSQNKDRIADITFDSALSGTVTQQYRLIFVYPDKSEKEVRVMAKGFYLGWDFPYKEFLRFYDCK